LITFENVLKLDVVIVKLGDLDLELVAIIAMSPPTTKSPKV